MGYQEKGSSLNTIRSEIKALPQSLGSLVIETDELSPGERVFKLFGFDKGTHEVYAVTLKSRKLVLIELTPKGQRIEDGEVLNEEIVNLYYASRILSSSPATTEDAQRILSHGWWVYNEDFKKNILPTHLFVLNQKIVLSWEGVLGEQIQPGSLKETVKAFIGVFPTFEKFIEQEN